MLTAKLEHHWFALTSCPTLCSIFSARIKDFFKNVAEKLRTDSDLKYGSRIALCFRYSSPVEFSMFRSQSLMIAGEAAGILFEMELSPSFNMNLAISASQIVTMGMPTYWRRIGPCFCTKE